MEPDVGTFGAATVEIEADVEHITAHRKVDELLKYLPSCVTSIARATSALEVVTHWRGRA